MSGQIESFKACLVSGRVTDKRGRPAANLLVRAYDRDMRSEELLGECITDKNGKYEIAWMPGQFSERGNKKPDIAVKVYTREKKTLLYAADMDAVRFGASSSEEIDITIKAEIKPGVVEYDHILKEVDFLTKRIAITDLQET